MFGSLGLLGLLGQAPYYVRFIVANRQGYSQQSKRVIKHRCLPPDYLGIIGGLLGMYRYIFEYIWAYLCIRVYSSRLRRRCSGEKSLIWTICTSPAMQHGVNDHSFWDICRPLWFRGIKDCAIVALRCQIRGRWRGHYDVKRPKICRPMAVK